MKGSRQYIIVDDDLTNNIICEYVVKAYDPSAEVLTFNEPELALSTIKTRSLRVDQQVSTVMFVDVNMPTMSGWEFLKEFEKLDEKITQRFTIFILSSSIEDFTNEKIRFPYVTGFLSKPLSRVRLEQLEDNWLTKTI